MCDRIKSVPIKMYASTSNTAESAITRKLITIEDESAAVEAVAKIVTTFGLTYDLWQDVSDKVSETILANGTLKKG
ncbi:MAG: hypothetical protein L0H99_10290 [Loigolactobacillus coryniformis]|uniref:Uncharacterized protein n=1 Tax=Loigolactobacillus coryniformis subsp. torquens DSM 20004 = KCTC 3535 TaxID=1423822 RepID=A0A2D1KMM6_9LACO|nr:hypothetical protein [Loigolactobacillus coryniformis]ATO43383.1 hypothetical protein LC20004_05440 [Loigolactobacillus coryniformis subsp. torquens DSM 20004 = KCTC 3535]MDN5951065.1 hypothetical protein [Loigolactobacillus coryniformis]MDN5954281.1 hypothetical protein [Loigolactobacillus coryniformis]